MAKKSNTELEQQRMIAFKKSYTRGRNQYANIDGSASILDWERSRLDAIARTRGFRTREGVDYAVANELGVSLTEEDIEAMLCLDKDVNDEQSKLHSSPLAVVMRQANEIVLLELMK